MTKINITATNTATVVLPIKINAIKSTVKKNNHLLVNLINGETLILEDFYTYSPLLLLNATKGKEVQQIHLNSEGYITGISQVNSSELQSLIGENTPNLTQQVSDVLLFAAPITASTSDSIVTDNTETGSFTSVLSYDLAVFGVSSLVLGSTFMLWDKGDKGGKENDAESNIQTQYDSNNNPLFSYQFSEKGNVEKLAFGDIKGQNAIAQTEDLRDWENAQLAKIKGLNEIILSDAQQSSTLLLDMEIISKLAPQDNRLVIRGDATDKVKIHDHFSDNPNNVGQSYVESKTSEGQTYKVFHKTIETTSYEVWVESDIVTEYLV